MERSYKVYAAVYPRPPPSRQMRTLQLAIFDERGRLVEQLGEDAFMGEYGHHFTKNQARIGTASVLEADFGISVSEKDVHIVSEAEVRRRIRKAKKGGSHFYVHAEHVPKERTLYLKGLFSLRLGNRVWLERQTIDLVRTRGDEDEEGLKLLIRSYLKKTFRYYVEPEEIHFITEKERAKYEALTA